MVTIACVLCVLVDIFISGRSEPIPKKNVLYPIFRANRHASRSAKKWD